MPPATADAPPEHTRHRFLVLDAMRGLAAVAVVAYHTWSLLGRKIFPHGYLAVDFFFLLSGFVLQYAYGRKLYSGMPTLVFLKARFARLYPMYLLGLGLGIAAEILEVSKHWDPYRPRTFALETVFGACMIPLLRATFWAFPLNFPTWSLFGEVLANLFHALILRRRSRLSLQLWAGLFGLLEAAIILKRGSVNFGAGGLGTVLLLPRVLFAYILGMLIERWWSASERRLVVPASVSFLLLLLGLAIRERSGHDAACDILVAMLLFPALFVLSTHAYVGRLLRGPAHLLGLLSYPLYIMHAPLYELFLVFTDRGSASGKVRASISAWLAFALLSICVSLAAEFLYDRPVRSWLRRRLHA